jgi:hypothetical protein
MKIFLNDDLAIITKNVARDCFKDIVQMKSEGTIKIFPISTDSSTGIRTRYLQYTNQGASPSNFSTSALEKRYNASNAVCMQMRPSPLMA